MVSVNLYYNNDLTIILFILFTVNFVNTHLVQLEEKNYLVTIEQQISNIFSVLVKSSNNFGKTRNHNPIAQDNIMLNVKIIT